MAVFHFEIKSDRRKSGKQTSALQHVKYINREGPYQDADERELIKMPAENVITGPELQEHAPGRELLLYSSPFGVIKQDDSGIRVSRNASTQTVAIALEVAKRLYGNALELRGQERFQQQAVAASSQLHLDIQFQSQLHQEAVTRKIKEQEHERRIFEAAGGRYGVPVFSPGDIIFPSGIPGAFPIGSGGRESGSGILESDTERHTVTEIARTGWSLPALSGGNVVLSGRQPDVLLSRNASHQLQRRIRRRQDSLPKLRWDVSGPRKNAVEASVKEILHNLQYHLDKTFASSHVQYINRESVFEQRGGCVYKAHHLPSWAEENPLNFFRAADQHERDNGERYKEIVFSLPNELSLSQQKEIIQRFLDAHMKNYYYTYAIHDKIGTMSNGEHHTHVHLMFSTREIDDCERKQERQPDVFFSRVNPNHPEKGGCRKSGIWNGKDRAKNLSVFREDFARIQNEVLAKYGIPVRVDHRSLKARRQEALAKGNTFLAELLDRVPERAVGPLALLERGNRNVLAQKKLRALNQSKEKNIVAKTFLMDRMRRDKLMKRKQELEANIKQLDGLLNQDEKAALAGTLQKIQSQQDALQAAFDASIWAAEATESSMLAFMTEDEREAWQTFKAAGQELKHWQDFYSSIQEDAFSNPAQLQELRAAINRETMKIRKAMRQQAPTICGILSRLNEAHTKRDIMRHAGNLLFDARLTKAKIDSLIQQQEKELAKLQDRYKRLTDSLRQSPSYTAGAVADYMDRSLKELYAKEHKVRAEMRQLAKHVISPARAKAMAENVYTKGEFKNLRAVERDFAKKTAAGKLSPEESTAQQKKLQEWRSRLESSCASMEAQAKIQEICVGILRKNAPQAMAYQKVQQEHQVIAAAITEAKAQADAARHQSYRDRNQTLYRATGATPAMGYMEPPHMIAAAMAGNTDCAVLVARSKKDFPDDWSLLSESEREDLKNDTSKMM